ncbi:MAG: hypothetical protein GXP35_13205 [Actinobacteria bacterium]|nr:hypothetical protein [Actinomycetota bacterium]
MKLHVVEIDSVVELQAHLDEGLGFSNVVLQGLDLTAMTAPLLAANLHCATFIGCLMSSELLVHAVETGAVVFPRMSGVPYRTGRHRLYSVDELYDGFDPDQPASYATTLDAVVYQHWLKSGRATDANVRETLARRLHDHGVTDALDEAVAGERIVAVMGGHGLARTDPGYAAVARMSRSLARSGYMMASGGGPGAMEATHLGPWLCTYGDEALDRSLDLLAAAPGFEPPEEWLAAAFRVRAEFPQTLDAPRSLGIPTWLYGHEPPNAFATDIAKYFANSVREDGLLTIATHGIVFTPGSAGTVQEVFQDATQNHYQTVGAPSPMVFFGTEFWTHEVPVLDVLRSVGAGQSWLELITVTDDEQEVVEAIASHAR